MIKVFLSKNPFMVFGVDANAYFMRMAELGWMQESFSKVYREVGRIPRPSGGDECQAPTSREFSE